MYFHSLHIEASNKRQLASCGFGLVELLVTISIMVIVMGIILVKQSAFDGAVLLRSQAYEVALRLRDIQLSTVSASGDNTGGTFRSKIGAYFTTNTTGNANTRFRIFNDADNDGYDLSEEFGPQTALDPRFEVRAIRVINYNGSVTTPTDISVRFERPNFDARFFVGGSEPNDVEFVEIDIARRGVTGTGVTVLRTLEITSAGQIAVQ
jgi:type II secretory pathway pseudopilin PulG